jgi:hypothetical protein
MTNGLMAKPPTVWGILSFREEGRPDKKKLEFAPQG